MTSNIGVGDRIFLWHGASGISGEFSREHGVADLDPMDVKILTELQNNARISNHDLAQRVGLSPSPCWRRVRRLEEDGVISRYATLLAGEAVGLHLTAFAHVSLENHQAETVDRFNAAIQQEDAVLECFSTSGEYDYLIRVIAPSMADYEAFLSGVLMQISAVRSVNTSFVLKCNKSTTNLPINAQKTGGQPARK